MQLYSDGGWSPHALISTDVFSSKKQNIYNQTLNPVTFRVISSQSKAMENTLQSLSIILDPTIWIFIPANTTLIDGFAFVWPHTEHNSLPIYSIFYALSLSLICALVHCSYHNQHTPLSYSIRETETMLFLSSTLFPIPFLPLNLFISFASFASLYIESLWDKTPSPSISERSTLSLSNSLLLRIPADIIIILIFFLWISVISWVAFILICIFCSYLF